MSKYHRTIKGVTIDIYDILRAYGVTSQPIGHAIKKLLMPGDRGYKDQLQDVQEAKQSIDREIEHLTIEHEQKDVTAGQALMRYKAGDWIICQHFQPKNNDGKVDVITYKHRQIFTNQEIERWEFDDISQNNSVYAWRPTAEKEVINSPAIDAHGWIENTLKINPVSSGVVVKVKKLNGISFGQSQNFNWSNDLLDSYVFKYQIPNE